MQVFVVDGGEAALVDDVAADGYKRVSEGEHGGAFQQDKGNVTRSSILSGRKQKRSS